MTSLENEENNSFNFMQMAFLSIAVIVFLALVKFLQSKFKEDPVNKFFLRCAWGWQNDSDNPLAIINNIHIKDQQSRNAFYYASLTEKQLKEFLIKNNITELAISTLLSVCLERQVATLKFLNDMKLDPNNKDQNGISVINILEERIKDKISDSLTADDIARAKNLYEILLPQKIAQTILENFPEPENDNKDSQLII